MSVNMRERPVLKGEDAVRFLEEEMRVDKALKEKVEQYQRKQFIKDFILELGSLWEQTPELRFGQLYDKLLFKLAGIADDGFYIKDEDWLKTIKDYYK